MMIFFGEESQAIMRVKKISRGNERILRVKNELSSQKNACASQALVKHLLVKGEKIPHFLCERNPQMKKLLLTKNQKVVKGARAGFITHEKEG